MSDTSSSTEGLAPDASLRSAERRDAGLLQAALRDIGVRMDIYTTDGAAFFERVLAGNLEAAFFA